MQQTRELKDFLTAVLVQSINSLADGGQFSDLPNFFDEFMLAPEAIKGLSDGFPAEATNATPEEVEELFEDVAPRLVGANLNPMIAGAIASNLKGLYYVFAAVKQSGKDAIELR